MISGVAPGAGLLGQFPGSRFGIPSFQKGEAMFEKRGEKQAESKNKKSEHHFTDGLFVPLLVGGLVGLLCGFNLFDPVTDYIFGVLESFMKAWIR